MEGPIGRSDVVKDDLLKFPIEFANSLKLANTKVTTLYKNLKGLGTSISSAKSTSALAKSTQELSTQEKELLKIQKQIETANARSTKAYQDQQKALQALKNEQKEKLALGQKDSKLINEQNSSITQLSAALNKNRAAYKALADEEARNTKEGKELKAIIDQQDASVKKLKGDLGDFTDNVGNYEGAMRGLKLELKAAKDEMAGIALTSGTTSKEFVVASAKAGEIKDKINDLNDALKNSSASKFENVGNSLKDVGAKLANLDFEGAAQAAKQFSAVSKSLTFKEMTEGLKSFGNTLATVGKAILTNPIFLIAAVVTAAVVAFRYYRDEQEKASKRQIDNYQKETDALTERYDQEIKLQQIVGKQTFNLERAKQKIILDNAERSIKAIGDVTELDIATSLLQGRIALKVNEDKAKMLGDFTKAKKAAANEIQIIDAEQAEFERKTSEDTAKKQKSDLFALNKFRLQAQMDVQKDIADNEETAYNDRVKASEKIVSLSKQLAKLERDEALSEEGLTNSAILLINEEYQAKVLQAKRNGAKEQKKLNEDATKQAREAALKIQEEEKVALEKSIKEQKIIIEQKYALAQEAIEKQVALVKQEVLDGKKTKEQGNKEIADLQKSLTDELVQIQIDRVTKLLSIEGLSNEEKLALDKELIKLRLDLQNAFYDQIEETQLDKLEKWAKATSSTVQTVQGIYENFAQAINTAFSSISERRLAELDSESKSVEDNLNKQLEAAGDNEQEKLRLKAQAQRQEAEIEKKRRAERRKTAQIEKITGIFSAGIAAALAVLNALSTVHPYPAAVVAAISAGVLGAVQVASIAAKPLPAFFTGVESAPGGKAVVGEEGSELMREPGNKFKMSPSKATVMDVKQGTKIWNRKETLRMLALGSINQLNTLGNRQDAFGEQQDSSSGNSQSRSSIPYQTNFYSNAMEIIQVDKFNDGRIARRRAKLL